MNKIFVTTMMLMAAILAGNVNAHGADTGAVIITEIMYDPTSTSDPYWEWFEIYNTTTGSISLENWKWGDGGGEETNFPAYNLGAGQWAVIYDSAGVEAQQFCDAWVDAGITLSRLIAGGNMSLLQDGEIIYLEDDSTARIDEVTYANGGLWPVNNDAASIYLKADKYNYTDNNDGASWLLSTNGVAGAVISVETFYTEHNNIGGDVGSPGAVPEPSAMMLLISGLSAVLYLRRIKK